MFFNGYADPDQTPDPNNDDAGAVSEGTEPDTAAADADADDAAGADDGTV